MDGNDWRAAQGQVQIPGQVSNGEVPNAPGMEVGDWRTQLQADSRSRIVNKIMETLKRHLPFSGPEGLQELRKIALRFEEKIYSAATSQSDYLRKISLKMLTMETKSQNPIANPLQSNAPSNSMNPPDQASQAILSQMQNQVQQMPMPMGSNQTQVRQQSLSQNMPNNIVPPSSTGSTPPVGGMSQGTIPSVPVQNPNLHNIQNIPSMSQNAAGASMGLGAQQRQIQGRPQQVVAQEQQQQQSQNSQQFHYNPQLQQHLLKQKFQQGNVPQSMMHSQIQQQQQQNLLQTNSLQSSQQALMQPPLRQMQTPSTLQPSQQPSVQQQSNQSMLQQQSQSVRQQQQQHQQGSMPQHPMMSLQQQQQIMGQQTNVGNMQQSQLIGGQPNSMLDAQQQHQQQRVIAQQNVSGVQQQQAIHQQNALQNVHQQQSTVQQSNLSNMHQQQVGAQANLSSFQPQQMGGIQHGNATIQPNQQPMHTLQHSKVSVQQQSQQNIGNMLPNQSQQPQSQPTQQQMASQFQSQPGQMQQQLGLQHQGNLLQRDMQQRIQSSGGPLLQQQTAIDQQKQLLQTQRVVPDPSANQSTQTGNASGGDWQEEVYQKIKSMCDMYFPELNEMFQRMAAKLQQHDALPQQPKNEQLEKLRSYKNMLERYMVFLRTSKNEVLPSHREKLPGVEKQIVTILNNHRPRKPPGQFVQPPIQAMQQSQQQQPQLSHNHNEGQMNSQMQQMNPHISAMTTQPNNLTSLQPISLSSGTGVLNSRQNMLDASQPGSSADPGTGHALNQIQQVAMSSLQQNPVSTPQQMNNNPIQSQSGLSPLQSNAYPLQANSNVLQPQQIKQEQQMFSTQQVKQQYQQRQMQHQFMQRQQLLQQQQVTQQQVTQLHPQQMMQQLNSTNDTNDIKMRHQMIGKPGLIQQHPSSGQRPSYHQQPMKSGSPYSISSQPILQAVSPQIGHHPSPQIDQPYLLAPQKTGTPLQSANSPFIAPSPSTSMAPSPAPVDSEKINPGMSSLLNAESVRNQPTVTATVPSQSLSIGTPGISASPLLAEFTSTDGNHGAQSTVVSGNSSALEQPLQRLIKAVKSTSPKTLSASVNDISSVVSMVDRIAGSAPGNGSRAAVGEDLVAMTKCRLQARNFFTQDGPGGTKKMRRYTSAVPSNVVSSTGSVNINLRHLSGNESDGESTGASSSIKRPRVEVNHTLEEELREINQRLIDTVVYISEEDVDPTAAAEGGGGIIVKCSYSAVALSHNLKSQYASAQMSPIQPLRLLIPKNYPNCSPILLDNFPVEVSKEYEDLSMKAKARFNISLRALEQPMSLGEIARTWDNCARAVVSEYAQKSGGGTFSSKYGTWESCLSAS